MAVYDFFDRGWRANPDQIAFVAGDDRFTYRKIGELSCRIANALVEQGHPFETKGAVLAPNDPTAWACVLGLWRAGMAWVPVNPMNAAEEIQRALSAFDCEVLFCHHSLVALAEKFCGELGGVKQIVVIGGSSELASGIGGITLDDFVTDAPPTQPERIPDPDMVAGIMPTGGTTGAPKGVMNTHRSLAVSVTHQMLAATYAADEPVVNLVAAPMTHNAGLLTLPVAARGGTVVVMARPDPVVLLDLIERERVTEIFLPPTVIYRLLEFPGIAERDFSSLKYLMYGAAPMSTEKLRRAIDLFGPVLFQGYGQTEAPSGVAFLRPEEHFVDGGVADDGRLSAAGRPAPMVRVEILDSEGSVLAAGEPGEVCVRGDLVMKGYYKNPEATAATIRDGWLHTGDVGFLDHEGYLHITDRMKDVIITGGFNVYPGEVEQVVWSHPAVQECAVIGLPDDEWGEAVAAVVELKAGARLTAEELIGYCRERLSGVKTPKTVVFTQALPRSANGKILKREIRAPYWSGRERTI